MAQRVIFAYELLVLRLFTPRRVLIGCFVYDRRPIESFRDESNFSVHYSTLHD